MFCNCEQEKEVEDLCTVYFLKTTSKLFGKEYVWISIGINLSVLREPWWMFSKNPLCFGCFLALLMGALRCSKWGEDTAHGHLWGLSQVPESAWRSTAKFCSATVIFVTTEFAPNPHPHESHRNNLFLEALPELVTILFSVLAVRWREWKSSL